MYDEVDVDTTFHIPVSSVIKAAVEEAKEKYMARQQIMEA